MWEIEYYKTERGECPTKEFLDSLHKKDELPFVLWKLKQLSEHGNLLPRPHADFLQDGIYELRIPVKHKQFRLLYFYFYQEKIVISHGIKKEKRIPSAEINRAKANRSDYFARNERKR